MSGALYLGGVMTVNPHININNIWNKIDEVKFLLNEGLFHILAISETKLDSTYDSFHL